MNAKQEKAARYLKGALVRVRDAHLMLRVYDGSVWVCPDDVRLNQTSEENVFDALEAEGVEVGPPDLNADGGAGV